MAIDSHERISESDRRAPLSGGGFSPAPRGRRRWPFVLAGTAIVLVALGAVAVLLATSSPSLSADSSALASVDMPLGGGTIESIGVIHGGPHVPVAQAIPVGLRGDKIYPRGTIPVNETVTIDVVVKRPGWVSWLTGKTQHLELTLTTPVASLRQHYFTLSAHTPLTLQFRQPVAAVSYGPSGGRLQSEVLPSPQSSFTLPHSAQAGSMSVSAAPRIWEQAGSTIVSWFPAGSATSSAVVTPLPGRRIGPSTPITVTFSKPVSAAIGSSRPMVAGATGHWQTVNSHTIVFQPMGYGYGLANTISLSLPKSVNLVGGQSIGSDPRASWTVPPGSTLRLQQLLANMGYLPLRFEVAAKGATKAPQAEEAAAIHPPKGTFVWRYHNVPSQLTGMWAPGVSGEMTKGAVMAFENDHGMTTDGVPSAALWHALIAAAITGYRSTFGYTIAMVSEGSPESINVWHSGRTVLTGAVNTGIAAAPTAQGVFAVFEHALSVTMSGHNPDGSYYSDPGVPYVSYFNGGDALHGFIRASYGFPQSLGCVEMPYSEAAAVYPYTPIGTIVDVS